MSRKLMTALPGRQPRTLATALGSGNGILKLMIIGPRLAAADCDWRFNWPAKT